MAPCIKAGNSSSCMIHPPRAQIPPITPPTKGRNRSIKGRAPSSQMCRGAGRAQNMEKHMQRACRYRFMAVLLYAEGYCRS